MRRESFEGAAWPLAPSSHKMKAHWMFMTLIGWGLFLDSQCQSNDGLKIVCVPAGHNVTVPCPQKERDATEVSFHLYQGAGLRYTNKCYPETNLQDCSVSKSDLKLDVNTDNESASFTLIGVNSSDQGTYVCERRYIFSPPYKSTWGGIILLRVEGHPCHTPSERLGDEGERRTCRFHWTWILLPLVSFYGVAVTICAAAFWVKLRKTESQSDYINTKPKASRDRRKKRGVLNPFTRHF